MLHRIIFGAAVLLGTAQAMTLTGCGGGDQHARGAHNEKDSEREAAAKRDLAKALKSPNEEGFQLIIKRHDGTAAADQARVEIAKLRDEEARKEMAKGNRKKARALANEALKTGDPGVADQARNTLEQIDRSDARHASKVVKQTLAGGQGAEPCASALEAVSETLGESPSAVLVRDVRKETLQSLSGCMQGLVDAANGLEGFAKARKVIDSPDAKNAVGADTWHVVSTALNDKTVAAMVAAVQPDIKSGKWEAAFAAMKQWADKGAAGPAQVEAASQQARDLITKDLVARGNEALGTAKAQPVLAEVERALKLFEGLNVSGELKAVHARLGGWLECKKIACTMTPKPKLSYTLGVTPLLPLQSAQEGTPAESLPNATKVWVLATGKGRSMVAKEDPGDRANWAQRFAAASGWVDGSTLQNEDTTFFVPMGKALENVRVWMPSGHEDKLYMLGIVQTVEGKNVTVKRFTDNQPTTVTRDVLRSGNLARGLKVLAFCGTDQLKPTEARFEEVIVLSGVATAKVTCIGPDGKDGKVLTEVLGSLRSKPEWLPPRKP